MQFSILNVIITIFTWIAPFVISADQTSIAPNKVSLWNLQQKWTDQNNKTFKLSDLGGHTTIATMTFINCPGACGLMISDMKEIDKKLTRIERKKLKFLTFSFDPNRDTPQALKTFHEKMRLDKRWSLYTSNEEQARKISDIFKFNYTDLGDGDYSHSTTIYLISKTGHILFRKESHAELDELIKKIRYDLSAKKR